MKTRYGWVEIDDVRYDHDIIIHVDRTVTRRSKKKSKKLKNTFGHTPLADHELAFLDKEKPEVIFIGTGQYGDLPITTEALQILKRFEIHVRPTPEILELFSEERRLSVAILHVTC
jgi:hypothetical protein